MAAWLTLQPSRHTRIVVGSGRSAPVRLDARSWAAAQISWAGQAHSMTRQAGIGRSLRVGQSETASGSRSDKRRGSASAACKTSPRAHPSPGRAPRGGRRPRHCARKHPLPRTPARAIRPPCRRGRIPLQARHRSARHQDAEDLARRLEHRQTGLAGDRLVRQQMAVVEAMVRASGWTAERARAALALGRSPGAEGSLGKLAMSDIARAAARVHGSVAGAAGMLARRLDGPVVFWATKSSRPFPEGPLEERALAWAPPAMARWLRRPT